jgi:hypothetical protein
MIGPAIRDWLKQHVTLIGNPAGGGWVVGRSSRIRRERDSAPYSVPRLG